MAFILTLSFGALTLDHFFVEYEYVWCVTFSLLEFSSSDLFLSKLQLSLPCLFPNNKSEIEETNPQDPCIIWYIHLHLP